VFRKVTLPLLMPGVIVAGLLVFTFSFDNVVMSQFLGGADAETLPVLVMGMIRREVTPEVNAIGVGIMLVMFLSIGIAAAVTWLRPGGGSRILGVERKGDK
jgi:spermidine/putrescine transport system permease protein